MSTKIYRQIWSTKIYRQEMSTCLQQIERRTRGSFCYQPCSNLSSISLHSLQYIAGEKCVPWCRYFLKYFLTVYSEFDISYLFIYEMMFSMRKSGFFSSIDERESFKNLKYLENLSSICENNVNLVLLRVLHYTIVKPIVYGICKRDYINHMPVISKLPIW